jgi:hypothetical protein
MLKVVFDSWLFNICLAWKVFINIPFHMGVCIPLFTFQEFLRCEHMEHKQIEWSLYFALHGVSRTSTPSPCLKKGTW